MCNGCKCSDENIYSICKKDIADVLRHMNKKMGDEEFEEIIGFVKNNLAIDWHHSIELVLEEYFKEEEIS